MNPDNDKLLNIEGISLNKTTLGWSAQERVEYLNRAKYVAFVAGASSCALSILPWIYNLDLPSFFTAATAVCGGLGLLTVVLIIYILNQNEHHEEEVYEEWHPTDILISTAFTACGLLVSICSLLFIFSFVQLKIDRDYFKATT